MDMVSWRIEMIRTACQWVDNKDKSVSVTTGVRWADWQRKKFSPAMCVLWWNDVQQRNDGYDTFRIPSSDLWVPKVASYLDVSEDWVLKFVEQCYNGFEKLEKQRFIVSFDSFETRGVANFRFELDKVGDSTEKTLPEAEFCLMTYPSDHKSPVKQPYWTKNPPIELYRQKLFAAAFDLFEALKAAEESQKDG